MKPPQWGINTCTRIKNPERLFHLREIMDFPDYLSVITLCSICIEKDNYNMTGGFNVVADITHHKHHLGGLDWS